MWTEKTAKGYRFIERYQNPLTLKWHRVSVAASSASPQAAKIAHRELDKKIAELTASGRAGKGLTLADLVEHYLADQKRTVKASTYRRNYYAVKGICRILGEDTLVEKITANYIRERMSETEEAAGTLNERLDRLKALLRWGYKNDYIVSIDYLAKVEHFKDTPKRAKIAEKFLEKEELQALLAVMDVPQWRLLAAFLALSGLRAGEAVALTRSDVSGAAIIVNKTYDPLNKIITSPKTATSNRSVSIQPELRKVINLALDHSRRRELACGYRSDLLFASTDGSPANTFTFGRYLNRIAPAVTSKRVTPHIFRHTHASLLMEAGVPIETISRRLGHENSKVTREIYLHVTERLKEKDAELIRSVSLL